MTTVTPQASNKGKALVSALKSQWKLLLISLLLLAGIFFAANKYRASQLKPVYMPPAGAYNPANAANANALPPALAGQLGKGAGQFDPRSQFKPLAKRDDVISWAWLSDVELHKDANKIIPTFQARLKALAGSKQRIQGYMMPLETRMSQSKFVMTSVPATCPYCNVGGPESIVQVLSKAPVGIMQGPIVMEGIFEIIEDGQPIATTPSNAPNHLKGPKVGEHTGFYYRLQDAVLVD